MIFAQRIRPKLQHKEQDMGRSVVGPFAIDLGAGSVFSAGRGTDRPDAGG